MSREITATPRALTELVRLLARGVTPTQYLREFIKNCLDALERGGVDPNNRGTIRIARDKDFPNKMVIANSTPGDPLTEHVAKEHLMSLANSGNTFAQIGVGAKVNHGVGAKISYVIDNPLGILFRCRSEGIQFTVWINPETNILELKAEETQQEVYNESTGEVEGYKLIKTQFPDCYEEDFTFPDSEVEAVLLGSDEQEDTWAKACDLLSNETKARGHAAGHLIADYVRQKWWAIPPHIDIEVFIYNKDKTFKETRSISFLKDFKEKKELHGTVIHPDDTTIEWYVVPMNRNSKSSHDLAGTPGCIHEDEVFIPSGISETARKKQMQQAGVWVRSKNVQILVKPPANSSWLPSIDRSEIVDSEGTKFATKLPDYLEYFRLNFPEGLREWLQEHTRETADDYKTAAKAIMARFASSAPSPNLVTAIDGEDEGLGYPPPGDDSGDSADDDAPDDDEDDEDDEDNTTTDNRKPRVKRKKLPKTGSEDSGDGDIPEFRMVNNGEEEPLITWDFAGHAVNINLDNPTFHYHKGRINDGHSYPETIVDRGFGLRLYLNSVTYYASVVYSYPSLAKDLLEEKLKDDKLDAVAINYKPCDVREWIVREINKQPEDDDA